jgi:class 3 adenylate cyclase
MHVLPAVASMQEAMAFMGTLHRNLSWLVVLFAMIAISAGFIELRRTQIELTEKNELLAQLSSKLAKFLPPQLYNSIFTGTHTTRVAAKRKKLTIFFSDIANFTETTDSLESEELTNLLNQYLTEMSKIALSHGATIDKYVGDAIMGFFGDPASRGSKEDAVACVEMAIAMQRRMRELQLKWADLGSEKPFQLRIGVNTGFCTVGNFGSEDRMDYTIIGNEVNLAARLQSHADLGGILVTHETSSLIKDTILTEEQEAVSVKGFVHPVRAYRVVGIYDELERDGRIIREERDGFRLLVDLTKGDQARTIAAVENVLARLKG